jgi:intraflagellar transport protein 172
MDPLVSWGLRLQVARGYLSDGEMKAFYRKRAREFEATHKYKEAEKAYLQVRQWKREGWV